MNTALHSRRTPDRWRRRFHRRHHRPSIVRMPERGSTPRRSH